MTKTTDTITYRPGYLDRCAVAFRVYGGSPNRWGWWSGGQLLANGGMTPSGTDHPCYAYRNKFGDLIAKGLR